MRSLKYLSMILLLQGFVALIPSTIKAQHTTVSLQLFYDELSPYGTWINHPAYGYVWLPMDDPDSFFPYGSNGHWVYTMYGWTWVSYYKWGWAPFHYGRWDFDPNYGWFWIPDVVWGPAWVVWRHAPGYYGWAPMRPGITIVIVVGGGYMPPVPWWIFCEHRHFGRRHINEYYTPRKHYGRILGESRIIERTYEDKDRASIYVAGPSKDDIRKETGRDVDVVTVTDRAKPGEELGNGTISIFRPTVERSTVADPNPVPRTIVDIKSHRATPATPVLPAAKEEPPTITTPEPAKATPAVPQISKAPTTTVPEKTKSTTVKPAPAKTPAPAVKAPAKDVRATPSTPPKVSKPSTTGTAPSSGGTQGTTATPATTKDDKDGRSSKKK